MMVGSHPKLREAAHWHPGPDTGSPVHVRKQMAHVEALHLRCLPNLYSKTLTHTFEENTTNLVQRKAGLGLRPTVRWHEVHVEILEGFGEVTRASDGGNDVYGFDETRRRLKRGCFMVKDEARVVTDSTSGGSCTRRTT
jgi:hypothetical protein